MVPNMLTPFLMPETERHHATSGGVAHRGTYGGRLPHLWIRSGAASVISAGASVFLASHPSSGVVELVMRQAVEKGAPIDTSGLVRGSASSFEQDFRTNWCSNRRYK